jgi:probable HAF family extracellular repeat protein
MDIKTVYNKIHQEDNMPLQRRRELWAAKALFCAFLMVFGSSPVLAQYAYTVTNLSQLIPGVGMEPVSINNSGQVLMVDGAFGDLPSGDTYTYSPGNLSLLNSNHFSPTQINDVQQISGYQTVGTSDHAFVLNTNTNTMTDLGTLGGAASYAYGINNQGQAVGKSQTITGPTDAFFYDSSGMHDLGTLSGGTGSAAMAINDNGEIIGDSYSTNGPDQAFVYSNGNMRSLGSFGYSSDATAINSSGAIAGYSAYSSNNLPHAFISDGTTLTDIGDLGSDFSLAYGINDQGDVVGAAGGVILHGDVAFLYHDGIMVNLNTLIPPNPSDGLPYDLVEAIGINDSGQIICTASGIGGVLLTPVLPAPAAFSTLTGLIGCISLIRRR